MKNKKVVWIIVLIAAVLLCCLLVIGAVGGYLLFKQVGDWNAFLSGKAPATPPAEVSTAMPGNGLLVVEKVDPASVNYPMLQTLAPGWTDTSEPGVQVYSVSLTQDTPVSIVMSWCTTTGHILDQNYEHLTWSLVVDDQLVDMKQLVFYYNQPSDRVCKYHGGVIRQWPLGEHVIRMIMVVSEEINDGWNDYPAGTYVQTYEVTVIP